jgi:hypothetical protein
VPGTARPPVSPDPEATVVNVTAGTHLVA